MESNESKVGFLLREAPEHDPIPVSLKITCEVGQSDFFFSYSRVEFHRESHMLGKCMDSIPGLKSFFSSMKELKEINLGTAEQSVIIKQWAPREQAVKESTGKMEWISLVTILKKNYNF